MPKKSEIIYKRKDGKWEGRYVRERDLCNREIYGYLYGKSYTEVKQKLVQKELHKTDINTSAVNFAKISEGWLDNKKLCIKESTLARYKMIIDKHIVPLLGRYDISIITADIVQQYMHKLITDGYAVKTANDILTVIKSILKYAEIKGFHHNCDLSIILLKAHKSEVEALKVFEQKRLCDYLVNNLDNRNLGILLCLYTGIRIGELCALKWSDIDMKEKVLSVNKTMIRIQNNFSANSESKTKITITPPKSETSIREIPLPNFIIDILKGFKRNSNAYILTGSASDFTEPRSMQHYFKTVLKKCGIREVKFHTLRHTFATRCVENGFEVKSLSEILGHSSVKITLDKYVHSSMKLKRKNMDKLPFLLSY